MGYPSSPTRWDDMAELVNDASDAWLPLDPYSPVTVDYFVHGGTAEECRFRYEAIVSAVWHQLVHTHAMHREQRRHGDTMQHVFSVFFGSGNAVYRVVWIEKDVPDA